MCTPGRTSPALAARPPAPHSNAPLTPPQRKGIEKRKRSKLEWDEAGGEWKRRYGYKRANDEGDVHVLDAKPGDVVRGARALHWGTGRCGLGAGTLACLHT